MTAGGPQTTEAKGDSRTPPVLLLVPLVFFALHLPALDHDFVWTDQGEVVMGLMIRPLDEWPAILGQPMVVGFEAAGAAAPRYYRPLQVLALSVIDETFGRKPRHFRALNFVLGAATAGLLAALVWLSMRDRVAALIAGLLYAVHPANLENHVWIAGLSHALAAFFLVASLLAAVRHQRTRGRLAFALSLAALMLALLSKENAVVGPVLLLLVAWANAAKHSPWGWTRSLPRLPRETWWLIGLQSLLVLLYVAVLRPVVLGGAAGGDAPVAGQWSIHLPTALGHWAQTLSWLLLPLSSNSSDVVRVMGSPLRAPVLLALFLLAASVVIWLRMAKGRSAFVALGLAWIWIAFLPTSGLVPINHLRGERYVSLSLLGLAFLLPALLRFFATSLAARRAGIVLCAILLAFYAERSAARLPDWRSERALFEADLAGDPLYREAYLQLARLAVSEGKLPAAKQMLERLRDIGPAFAGHTSYLNAAQVIGLYCGINREIGTPADSLDYFARLDAESPMLSTSPGLAHCGAMSWLESGEPARALPILEALYTRGGPYANGEVALEIAFAHARARRMEEARRWLGLVDAVPNDRALLHKLERTRALVAEAAR